MQKHYVLFNPKSMKKERIKIYVYESEKNVPSKLHVYREFKTREQTVQIQMRWLTMSHLIWISAVCKLDCFHFGALGV